MYDTPLPLGAVAWSEGGGAAAGRGRPSVDPGTQPHRTIHELTGTQDLRLNVSDITGSRPGLHGSLRPRSQPTNPLDPQYPYLPPPRNPEMPLPPRQFIRNAMDVSDIAGTKPPAARPARSQPTSLDLSDIEGAKPGWRSHTMSAGPPRDVMQVADINAVTPNNKERHRQLVSSSSARSGTPAADQAAGSSSSTTWAPAVAGPDHGVACTATWRRQQQQAKVQHAGAVRQAWKAADAAIATVAAKATAASSPQASPAACSGAGAAQMPAGGLAGIMQSLKALDRDKSGRVQASELASALHHSTLGLSQAEARQLAASVQDSQSSVDYLPFMSKVWGKMQGQAGTAGELSGGSSSTSAIPPKHQHVMPQFIAARQRRLQTGVAVSLGQQPEALAWEAADVAALPGHQPWKVPEEKPYGKRMEGYTHPPSFESCHSFSGGDTRAAEAARQWKLSRDPGSTWAALRRSAEQSKPHADAVVTMKPIPTNRKAAAEQQQRGRDTPPALTNYSTQSGLPPGRSAVVAACYSRATPAISSCMRGDSPPLAAERAARVATQADVALVRSLS
ncbi:hypothetical protein ACK3TF_001679 [Chlorella vulgaris]